MASNCNLSHITSPQACGLKNMEVIMMSMEKLGAFVGGALFATVGAKILASKDAQKVYVYTTAAALRERGRHGSRDEHQGDRG